MLARCAGCGAPRNSSIHDVTTENVEIRMGAHVFVETQRCPDCQHDEGLCERCAVRSLSIKAWKECGWADYEHPEPCAAEGKLCVESVRIGYEARRAEFDKQLRAQQIGESLAGVASRELLERAEKAETELAQANAKISQLKQELRDLREDTNPASIERSRNADRFSREGY
jgi:outer membrane murein-binding lipoprotein Lpp